MILVFAGFAAVCTMSTFVAGSPTGNDINSRKRHEKEVMYITHEHNRLDQSNLGFILHAFLFAANKAVLGNVYVDAAVVVLQK